MPPTARPLPVLSARPGLRRIHPSSLAFRLPKALFVFSLFLFLTLRARSGAGGWGEEEEEFFPRLTFQRTQFTLTSSLSKPFPKCSR